MIPSAVRTTVLAVAALAGMGVLAACDPTTGTGSGERPSTKTVHDIPANYLRLYRAAESTCGGLDWSVLAAIGKVESDHGRSTLRGVHSGANSAGARGPMQFLPATFKGVRKRHPDVGPNVYDPAHAIPAAAHYLCDSGVRAGKLDKAIFAYNHANWYVRKVKNQAATYRAAGGAA